MKRIGEGRAWVLSLPYYKLHWLPGKYYRQIEKPPEQILEAFVHYLLSNQFK